LSAVRDCLNRMMESLRKADVEFVDAAAQN
jgi:hypothetical protein